MGSLLPSWVSPRAVALGSLGSGQRDVLILVTSCGVRLSHSGDRLSHRCGPSPRPERALPKGRVQAVRPSQRLCAYRPLARGAESLPVGERGSAARLPGLLPPLQGSRCVLLSTVLAYSEPRFLICKMG